MLSLEPFSERKARRPSDRVCLAWGGAYESSTAGCRFGSYTPWCFHMDSTVAAMRRASESLARFGLVPAWIVRM